MEERKSSILAVAFALIAVTTFALARQGSLSSNPQPGADQADTIMQSPAGDDSGQTTTQTRTSVQSPATDYDNPSSVAAQPSPPQSSSDSSASDAANAANASAAGPGTGNAEAGAAQQTEASTPMQIVVDQAPLPYSDAVPVTVEGRLLGRMQAYAEQAGGSLDWNPDTNSLEVDIPGQAPMMLTTPGQVPSGFGSGSDYESWSPDQGAIIGDPAYASPNQLSAAYGDTND